MNENENTFYMLYFMPNCVLTSMQLFYVHAHGSKSVSKCYTEMNLN